MPFPQLVMALMVSLQVFLEHYGLLAMFLVSLASSVAVPLPSEIVLPFGGFLVFLGYFSMLTLVVVVTAGTMIGSLLAYHVGTKMTWIHGFSFLEEHLRVTQKFFDNHGAKAVFVGQLLPVVRVFISFPAGFAKMSYGKFVVLTLLGALVRNSFLVALGYILGENWGLIYQYSRFIAILVVLSLPIAYLCYRKFLSVVDKL